VHPEVVSALRCPVEAGGLEIAGRSLRCAAGHTFDLARQGYVNLVSGRDPGTGDDAAMVAAREEALGSGCLAAITACLSRRVAGDIPVEGVVVDLGAGTGHHLAAVLDAVPDRVGVAIDLSKHAARRAARRHPRIGAVVADVWQDLPIRTGVAGAVLCVFAPRNAAEIARVLRPDGVLTVITPLAHHLAELVGPLGLLDVDPRKQERLSATLAAHLTPSGAVEPVETSWRLDRTQAAAIAGMGPSADHLPPEELARRVATLPDEVTVTAAVELRTFRPRRAG
jgi:23S rRNA (guanine745-N1)-methyltransferase